MSADNAALVRSIYDNFAQGNIPQVLAALDPDIEWIEPIPTHSFIRS